MKKRVEQLLNGKFEYAVTPLSFSDEKLELSVHEGEVLQGSFLVSNPSGQKVKGFLYSSNPRMTYEPMEFYGIENTVHYQLDTEGMLAGEETEGYFTVCTDKGEYQLPFHAAICTEKKPEETTGLFGTPDLSELARKDFQKAYQQFRGKGFYRLLEEKEPENAMLYQALRPEQFSYQSLEEYLVGCGEKEPVGLSLGEYEIEYKNLGQSVRETVDIHKDNWGFLCMEISSDARFLRPEKKLLTTDEFAGSKYELAYIIDTNFLHAGRNYGRIKITTCYQALSIEVTVVRTEESDQKRQHRIQKLMRKRLEALYIDFRLKRIDMNAWIDRSEGVIEGYRRAGGDDVFADLFEIQLLFAAEKRTKGSRLLHAVEEKPSRLNTPEKYAFYLYISTFYHREADYVDQVEARIEQLFLQNRDSWVLQWILLYLQERLMRDERAKLDAIAEQVKYGCSSPIMYLEACLLYVKDPYLLRRLDAFEKKILVFAAEQKLITEEMAHQIGNLAQHTHEYDRQLFVVLKECYGLTHSPEVLHDICTILIAGGKKDSEYFEWYALGVKQELRITGLYEYYMEAMDQHGIEKMPQIIRMYFIYNNTLDYRKRARIYRSISDNRDSIPQVYRTYRASIENFVIEQLGMGRIDADLAVLYEQYLDKKVLTRTLAERLVKVLFTFEITCKNPNISSIIVVHRKKIGEQIVPLVKGKATVQIYSADARILLADANGNRYASTALYMAERYLESPQLLAACRELVPESQGLVLYICGMKTDQEEITKDNLPFFKYASEMDTLTPKYRAQIRGWIMDYYMKHPKEDELFEYLKGISYPLFIRENKKALMTLLTEEGMYEEAFRLLEQFGTEKIPLNHLVRICSQTVLAKEYEEHTVLLSYCRQCFDFGKYDDNILTYLLMYYDGPVEEMKRLWVIGHQYELDTMILEEKILSLILFTRTGTSGTEQIFASYQNKLGRRKISRAYINLKAYEYFVKSLPVHDLIFGYIEKSYEKGADQEDICRLALLQYYSRQSSLTDKQKENVQGLLSLYNDRGIRFAFYQLFPSELIRPYQLEDKVFLEYVADPENAVFILWRVKDSEEEFVREPMKDCFEGVFVKEFVLFAGDRIECQIEEVCADETIKKTGSRILNGRNNPTNKNDRFDLINRMCVLAEAGKEKELAEEIRDYRQMEYLTNEIFTLI